MRVSRAKAPIVLEVEYMSVAACIRFNVESLRGNDFGESGKPRRERSCLEKVFIVDSRWLCVRVETVLEEELCMLRIWIPPHCGMIQLLDTLDSDNVSLFLFGITSGL